MRSGTKRLRHPIHEAGEWRFDLSAPLAETGSGLFGEVYGEAQGALDGDLAVPEVGVGKYLGMLAPFKGQEGPHDTTDVLWGELAVLLAEVLA